MKKILACVFSLLLVCLLAAPVSAASELRFSVIAEAQAASRGEQVTFTVRVSGGQKCTSLGYIPEYDTDVLELVSGECVAKDAVLSDFSPKDGGVLLYSQETALEGETVFRFTVRVKDQAALGETVITGTVAAKNGNEVLKTSLTDGKLTIKVGQTEPTEETTQVSQPQTAETAADETVAAMQTEPSAGESAVTEASSGAAEETTAVQPTDAAAQTGTESVRETTQEADAPKSSSFPWWIISLVVLAAAGTVAVVIIKKKKQAK